MKPHGLCGPITHAGQNAPQGTSAFLLNQKFNLGGKRAPEIQFYHMETKVIRFAPDGKHSGVDTLVLDLKCVPAALTGKDGDEYTCLMFLVQNDEASAEIPALKGWTYIFRKSANCRDEKGQVLGIDHAKFEKLLDDNGKILPPGTAYLVYNSFVDFHSFCDVFARPTSSGRGIQDLQDVGQKLVHQTAFSEPPVNLGSNVANGSTFKNGEVTLDFKGLGLVKERPCAVVMFDSGESSFTMIMNPLPNLETTTVGASHYKGDIFIDLDSNWVRKVEMTEFIVSETTLPIAPVKTYGVVERQLMIESVKSLS